MSEPDFSWKLSRGIIYERWGGKKGIWMRWVFGGDPGRLPSRFHFCSVTLHCPLPEPQEFLLLCTCPSPLSCIQLKGIFTKRLWLTLTLPSITRNKINLCFKFYFKWLMHPHFRCGKFFKYRLCEKCSNMHRILLCPLVAKDVGFIAGMWLNTGSWFSKQRVLAFNRDVLTGWVTSYADLALECPHPSVFFLWGPCLFSATLLALASLISRSHQVVWLLPLSSGRPTPPGNQGTHPNFTVSCCWMFWEMWR